MKTKPGHFIPLPKGFSVEVPSQYVKATHMFVMHPSGIYVTWQDNRGKLHYAGKQAGEACVDFEIPAEPSYLRKLSKAFSELADKIESKRKW